MIHNLGEWFVSKYSHNFEENNLNSNLSVLWRCSKSDRAKESGHDFMNGFNGYLTRGNQVCSYFKKLIKLK